MPCIIKIIIFNNEINKVFLNVLTKISIGRIDIDYFILSILLSCTRIG